MLIDFFYTLREARLPVSVKEYLTLVEALRERVIAPSLDEFYYLARLTLVKDERYFDRFDQAFAAYFRGTEQLAEAAFDAPPEWLKKRLERDFTPELLGSEALRKALAPHGIFVLEHLPGAKLPLRNGWECFRQKRYGATEVAFLRPLA